jgi:general stress protein YciG
MESTGFEISGFSCIFTHRGGVLCEFAATRGEQGGRDMAPMDETKKSKRGFASMDREKQRVIASKGGHSVPDEKRSFSQNPELAASAGRKGGLSVNPDKRSFSRDHTLASEAGRKGGYAE